MAPFRPLVPVAASSLAVALIASSKAPLLLLAEDLTIIRASTSFCSAFGIDAKTVEGTKLASLGSGEWNIPQLQSLLRATSAGAAAIHAYEMNLVRDGHKTACLVLNAHKLDYCEDEAPRIVLAVTDITSARLAEKLKDELVRKTRSFCRSSNIGSPTVFRLSQAFSCRARARFSRKKQERISMMPTTE